MSDKHTPGPWRVQATGHSFVVEANTHTEVISVDENGDPCRWSEYNEATARLIAAAPDLLEALKLMVAMAETGMCDFNPHDEYVMDKAKALIDKVTGWTS
jgi:hypothetical protein